MDKNDLRAEFEHTRHRGVNFYIKKINDYFHARANADLKEFDITVSQLDLLMYLMRNSDKSALQKELEQFFSIKHSSLIGILKRMEKKELLQVEENPDDRRGNRVTVLPKGEKTAYAMAQKGESVDVLFADCLTLEEMTELERLLKKVCEKMYENDRKEGKCL